MPRKKAIAEKKKRGRPVTGIGPAIGLRLHPDLDRALGGWIEAQPDPKPSQPAAIRQLLSRTLRLRSR